MRRLSSVICAAAVLVLAPGLSRAITRDVEIHDDFFFPAAMEVAQGDSIRWTHLGNHPHTVDQNEEEGSCLDMFGGFSSGLLTNGNTFVWVAEGLGDVYYHCDFHCPTMVGELTVQESTPAGVAVWGAVKALYR